MKKGTKTYVPRRDLDWKDGCEDLEGRKERKGWRS